MKYLKIAAHALPSDLASRSRWAADMLDFSLRQGLAPIPVPEALVTRFTVCLPDALANSLQNVCAADGHPLALTAAMLIAAAQQAQAEPYAAPQAPSGAGLTGEACVREVLRPLLHRAWDGIQRGQVVFAEAATGTGKGRLVASLAASASGGGATTVVAAPLSVLFQLVLELRDIQTEVKPLLLLGRANFVDPEKLKERLDDEENPALQKWFDNGGLPHAPEFRALSDALHVPLRWLAEDALALDDNLDIGNYLLDEDADSENPAEMTYKAAFDKMAEMRQEGQHPLILCSHLMLAVDSKLKSLAHEDAPRGVLPPTIDTLVIDEAHLLERAFATVHTNAIHLFALERKLWDAELPAPSRSTLANALEDLTRTAEVTLKDDTLRIGRLGDFPLLASKLETMTTLIREALGKKGRKELSAKAKAARRSLSYARQTMEIALSGYATLQLSATPKLRHPLLACGRNNLDKYFEKLWKSVKAGVLTSATLYAPDVTGQQTAGHIRWILNVPKERAAYPAPVIPPWVTATASLIRMPGEVTPDDSPDWLDQTARQLEQVYQNAKGGTLALCTSYATVEALTSRLKEKYPNLLSQSPHNSATRCSQIFRQQAAAGVKPLWLGVGNAWTGIDLADKNVSAENDTLLTDLYIPRIPYGCNRTLTHHRRREALGFMVEVHETARMLKQGLGRLVRREGLRHRHIWLADIRLENPTPPMKPLLKLLAPYKNAGS